MREVVSSALARSRDAFERRDWAAAHASLLEADNEAPLTPPDLERLAMAAHLVGLDKDSMDAWTRAHRLYVELQQPRDAARCAFWLGFLALVIDGDPVRSSGWTSRAQRLLDEAELDCVECGYLALLPAIMRLFQGDFAGALAGFHHAASYGDRFHDPNVLAICRLGTGQVHVASGRVGQGMALLDEVMVSVTAGEVSPVFSGIIYCAVITECQQTFDVQRARVWTDALDQWSATQPGLVPYRRQCLVHRAEILRFHGKWPEAQEEAARACDLVSQVPDHASTGEAWYQRAEIHRLRGQLMQAEEAYRQAARLGRSTNPGLALLRLSRGQSAAAASSLRRELNETAEQHTRGLLLVAMVEVVLDQGNVEEAKTAADELTSLASDLRTPLLDAMAARARGAVALAQDNPASALPELRRAWKAWFELEAPYEAARVRVLIAQACRALGDADSAELELDAAAQIFARLGAAPDLEHARALMPASGSAPRHGLTEREVQVLRLVVLGKTNHSIASELVISDHTVRRHLQNIFAKLGVSSRAAATAFALQHGLI